MASTESKIRLIFDGVDRVSAVARKVQTAVKGMSSDSDKLSKSFATLSQGADKVGTGLAAMAKGVVLLGAAGAAAQNVGALVGATAQLAPIALLLPGALLAGAAAMGAFKIATAGFGEAIGAGLSGDMAKFAEATKDMAPAMQQAAKAVVAFKPQIDDLKRSVQQNFWSQFAGDIGKLGNNLLPVMKSGLSSIAGELGKMVKGAVDVASTPMFRGQIASILVSTRAAIENMRPALGNVLAGFVSIGEVGARFLPQIAQSITEVTAKFKEWATSVEGQNQIKKFIENAIQGFKDLIGIVKNVGSILNSVFDGLGVSMESPLAMLKDLTGQLAEFLKTAEAQEGLKALGEILQEAGTAVKEVFLAAVKELLPAIKAWAPAIKEIILGLKDFALDLINTVGPALRDVGGFLSEHKDLLRDLVPIVAGAVLAFKGLKVLTEIAGWARGAFGALRTLAGLLPGIGRGSTTAAGGLKGMVLPLKGIAGVVGVGLIAAEVDKLNIAAAGGNPKNLQGMADDLHELVSAGERLITGDFSVIDDNINDIKTEAQNFIHVWKAGKAPIQEFADTVNWWLNPSVALLKFHLDNLRPAIAGFEAGIQGMPQTVGDSLVNLGDVIVGFGTKVTVAFNEKILAGFEQTRTIVAGVPVAIVNALSPLGVMLGNQGATATGQFTNSARAGFDAAVAIIRGVPGSIVNALSPLGGLLGNTATTSTGQFTSAARAGFDAAVGIIRGVPNSIVSALSPLAGLLGNTAATSTERFRAGAQAGFNAAVSNTRAVPGQVNGALSPLAGQLGTTGANAGSTFNSRLSGALSAAAGQARAATAGVAGAVAGALSGLGAVGSSAGAALGAGLVRGINSMGAQVSAAASRIAATAAAATRAAAGIQSPSKVFAAIGKQLGEGLVVGLAASTSGVIAAAQELLGHISSGGTIFEDFSFRGMSDNVRALNDQLVDMFRSAGGGDMRSFLQGVAGDGLGVSAPSTTSGLLQQLLTLQQQGQQPPQVRVFIGDTELTNIVRTEIDTSNRATRRTVGAGAGTTF